MSNTHDMRRDFEAWMLHTEKIIVGSSDPYPAGLERERWRVWKAAKECATAQQDSKDAMRYRLLKSEAYEAVVPHGNTLGGFRTAWITKLHPGEDFDAAIDEAIRQGGDT